MSHDKDIDTKDPEVSQYVVHKDNEPGVINNEMIQKSVRAYGPKGEAARLCRNIAIDYKLITELRLEFQNLLKIDHLWMLINLEKLSLKCNKLEKIENLDNLIHLRELDLSFNCIERIENLECLHKLEYLTLFRNKIQLFENLECLTNLVRLSVGNNLIVSTDGMVRLRFLSKLYSLNIEGNPVIDKLDGNVDFRLYIAAYLPNLKYYNYSIISDLERENGRKLFKNELRVLEETEREEIGFKEKQLQDANELMQLTQCFVEYLNKDQLFDSLFASNDLSEKLNSFAIETDHLINEHRKQIHNLTQAIYKLGIDSHAFRTSEINQLDEALTAGRNEAQTQSIEIITNFLITKSEIVTQTKQCYRAMAEIVNDSDMTSVHFKEIFNQCDSFDQKYGETIDNVWFILMEIETTLHERIEETNAKFAEKIKTMLNDFLKKVEIIFDQIKTVCVEFFKMLNEKKVDKSNELYFNLIANSSNDNVSTIDRREDLLVTRAKKWLSELLQKYEFDEYERNRLKILEINSFLDAQRTAFAKIKDNLIIEHNLSIYF